MLEAKEVGRLEIVQHEVSCYRFLQSRENRSADSGNLVRQIVQIPFFWREVLQCFQLIENSSEFTGDLEVKQ